MKDTFTQKVTVIPSNLADRPNSSVASIPEVDQNRLTPSDNSGRVRRSAAMIGLAISMSATGIWLAQNKAAIAAESLTDKTSIPSVPAPSQPRESDQISPNSDNIQLAPLALKHKVQSGESIKQLAQEYQIKPEAIAATNQISARANLVPGQTIKIPSLEELVESATTKHSLPKTPQSYDLASKSLNTSLDHLRETRKRLQDSLAELKTEKSHPNFEASFSPADVSDVSQPFTAPEVKPEFVSLSTQTEAIEEIVIPVFPSDHDRVISPPNPKLPNINHSVPKNAPKHEQTAATIELPKSEPSSSSLVSPMAASKQEKPNETTFSLATSSPDLPSVPPINPQATAKAESNQPIPILVPTPETEAIKDSQGINPISPQETSFVQPDSPIPSPTVSKKTYQVKPGDTLNSIARRHGLTMSQLIKANGISNPNLIKVNQSLVIPQAALTAQSKVRSFSRVPDQPFPLPPSSSGNNLIERNLVAQQQNAPIEIPTVAPDTYTEKLRADVTNLQQEYGKQPESVAVEVEPHNTEESSTQGVIEEDINAEWASDRQPQPPSSRQITRQIPVSPRNAERPSSQLIGTAPGNAEEYNGAFQIPVGTNVSPELPPLSIPDDYLPDAPMKFTGYIWPTKGVLTSGFGPRWGRMHKGIDVAAPIGTPIMAAAPGEVISAGWNSGGYGKLVKVRHPDGSVTLYAHNNRILVRRGQQVEQGQQISEMGSTGRSTGPHLHFEIHPNGKGAINPMAFLPKKRDS